jgi:hypothetical protein
MSPTRGRRITQGDAAMAPTRTTRVPACLFRHPEEGEGDGNPPPPPEGDGLGEKGKAALDAERKARRDAEHNAKQTADELAKLREEAEELRKKAMDEDERKIADAVAAREVELRKELGDELAAERASTARTMLSARILAGAAGKLTNAADAAAFIDIDALDRDDQGNVADGTVSAAIEALITERPYLAAKAGAGSADQGHRRDGDADFKDPKQLEAELAKFKLHPRR